MVFFYNRCINNLIKGHVSNMDKITKSVLMTVSINAILDSAGCEHPFYDQDINDYDIQDMFDDSDDSNDS